MRVTLSNRIITLAAGAVIALGAQALLPQGAAAGTGPALTGSAGRGAPWLTGDTAGAGLRWAHGGAVADAVGKIFFTLGSTDYVCSGALVRSAHVDVVLTAAHCVSGGPGQWATNWTFVPGYRDGTEPFGQYTARRFFVSPKWAGPDGGTERYDVAFVQVTRSTLDGRSRVAAAPPGLPVTFAPRQTAAALPRTYVFGYPALAPFSGLYPNYCAGRSRVVRAGQRVGSAVTACAMSAGDSGGPWFSGFSPRAGRGGVVAVTAYKLSGEPRTLYGTVLGRSARALYLAATQAVRVGHTIRS
jgi:hypothetical protein